MEYLKNRIIKARVRRVLYPVAHFIYLTRKKALSGSRILVL